MSKKIKLLAATLVFSLSSGAANADFSGAYEVGNWIFYSSDGGGSINLAGASSSIILTSSNTGDTGDTDDLHDSDQDFTVMAAAESWVSFDWDYLTLDVDGPDDDPAFFYLNNSDIQLSDSLDSDIQSGHFNSHVYANDDFGFGVHSYDSSGGSASLTVYNFNVTAVPEPETYAMFMAGLGLMGFMARRRKQKEAASRTQ